jgi:hypothetical protein
MYGMTGLGVGVRPAPAEVGDPKSAGRLFGRGSSSASSIRSSRCSSWPSCRSSSPPPGAWSRDRSPCSDWSSSCSDSVRTAVTPCSPGPWGPGRAGGPGSSRGALCGRRDLHRARARRRAHPRTAQPLSSGGGSSRPWRFWFKRGNPPSILR